MKSRFITSFISLFLFFLFTDALTVSFIESSALVFFKQLFIPLFFIIFISFLFNIVIGFSGKWLRRVFFVIFSVLYFSVFFYFQYFNKLPSFYDLNLVGQLADVKFSILGLIDFKVISYVVLSVCIVILIELIIKYLPKDYPKTFSILFLSGLVFLSFNEAVNLFKPITFDAKLRKSNMYENFTISLSGVIGYYVNILSKIERVDKEICKNLDKRFRDYEKVRVGDEQLLKLNGRNIYIIQLESFPIYLINLKVNSRLVAPNLNKIYQKAVYSSPLISTFSGGGSSDSEFSLITSLMPLEDRAVFVEHSGTNKEYNLFKVLEELGYTTSFFHGNDSKFWNMGANYKKYGVDNICFRDSFVRKNIDTIAGIDGIDDKDLFQQTVEKLSNIASPHLSFIITMTSHHPFRIKERADFIFNSEIKDNDIKEFLNSIYYTDKWLGWFYDEVRKSDEKSIFVIYGDHYVLNPKIDDVSKELGFSITDEYIRYSTPLIIDFQGGDNSNFRKDVIPNQTNILPTLLNMVGKSSIGFEYVGTSLLDKTGKSFQIRKGDIMFNGNSSETEAIQLSRAKFFCDEF